MEGARLYSLELDEIVRLGGQLKRLEHLQQNASSPSSEEIVINFNAKVKEYFENVSKVVDENGEPLVVYHGTESPVAFSVFKGGKSGYLGPGIYFTPELRIAHRYRGFHDPENGTLYSCFVNIRKPLRISYAEKPAKVILDMVSETAYESRAAVQANESKMLRKGDLSKVKRKGYDGIVWLPKVAYDTDSFTSGEMLLFDSTQIKSATDNRGTFDGGNADITFSVERNLAAVHSLSAEKFLGALDKVMRGKHVVSVVALRQLPAALAAPVCIAVSDTPGCLEVITELKEGQHNVLVAVQLDSRSAEKKEVKVNRIASMYGKERIASLLNHPMLYWDKAKARVWMQAYRLQLPAQVLPKRASGRRIQTPADLVK